MKSRKGMGMSPRGMTEEERFWSKVDKSAGPDRCWEWTAALDVGGYGKWSPVSGKTYKAHRYAYTLACGEIPLGLCVCHKCDNPKCVNPAHLFLGTLLDNHNDMKAKGRGPVGERSGRRTHPECTARGDRCGSRTHPEKRPRGERNPSAKLTIQQVRAMREIYAAGRTSYDKLAIMFSIGKSEVARIVRKQVWKDKEG